MFVAGDWLVLMVEIELSTIPDADVDVRVLTGLCEEFGAQNNVRVRIKTMTWGMAWNELMTIASHGRGPHISHIGNTWTSSLAMMNALRAFKPAEIKDVGGGEAFMVPSWQSARMFGEDEDVFALPWTGYTYVISYRKDLLRQVGIDPDTAFGTYEVLGETIQRLSRSDLEIPWLAPIIIPPYTDYLHHVASWIWGAGGDMIDASGKRVIFDSPEAKRGVAAWLDVYRAVRPSHRRWGTFEGIRLFAEGKAAACLTDIRIANSFVSGDAIPIVRENMGVAPLTHIPWTGGANLVIWRHTLGYPDVEKMAVKLVQYLAGKPAGLRWAREVKSMPARNDVLGEIYPPQSPLHEAVAVAARQGRTYPSVPLWHRLEYQLALEMGVMITEIHQDSQKPSAQIVDEHLDPLARRLNLTFGN
jgi:multiple sugar transport system substrate-binding protein